MKSFGFILALSFLVSSCDDLSGENTVTLTQLQAQYNEIMEFVEKEGCTGDSECKYLPIGSKSCGGPSGYIVYPESVDEEALIKMIEKYTVAQRIYNKENNIISDCSIPNPPAKLGCIDNGCIEI